MDDLLIPIFKHTGEEAKGDRRGNSVCCGAAPGSANRPTSALPNGAGTNLTSGTTTTVSDWFFLPRIELLNSDFLLLF